MRAALGLTLPKFALFSASAKIGCAFWNVRRALDRQGFDGVRIVVSGGFTVEKIRAFEEAGVPVDSYGVGSSLFNGHYDFTADIVRVNGRAQHKAGREERPNPRLAVVT